jgi:SAM-dependent MidA family methyltransferase
LNIDYGQEGASCDSVRAVRRHREVGWPYWLQMPGEVDLSTHVDFTAIGNGPSLPQGLFLERMGMKVRMDSLLQHVDVKTADRIKY